MSGSKSKRVNVNFSGDAYQTLEDLAKSTNRTMSEVLRDAIALEKWIYDRQQAGEKILTMDADGKLREVLFR